MPMLGEFLLGWQQVPAQLCQNSQRSQPGEGLIWTRELHLLAKLQLGASKPGVREELLRGAIRQHKQISDHSIVSLHQPLQLEQLTPKPMCDRLRKIQVLRILRH